MAFKAKVWSQLSLQAKVKQTAALYQVLTKIQDVYEVTLPVAVAQTLSVFEVFSLNLDNFGIPLQLRGQRAVYSGAELPKPASSHGGL